MLGYRPVEGGVTLSKLSYGLAGAGSGVITRMTAQPLDVLKIRFQLQVEPISRHCVASKYTGVGQAIRSIMVEEGTRAFWKGHVPAQGLSIIYGIVQFLSFELSSKHLFDILPDRMTSDFYLPYHHFLCGAFAGCAATIAAHPFDVIRTRFVAQGNQRSYTSMAGAFSRIVSQEGALGLYRGLGPTLLQIAPQNGFTFMFYTALQGVVHPTHSRDSVVNLLCGSISGTAAKIIVYPLDMIKKRLQITGFDKDRVGFGATVNHKGALHCLKNIISEEGATSLFKGLQASILKAAFVSGMSFWAYEYCCNVFKGIDYEI